MPADSSEVEMQVSVSIDLPAPALPPSESSDVASQNNRVDGEQQLLSCQSQTSVALVQNQNTDSISSSTVDTVANDVALTYPSVCRNIAQFKAWQHSRAWLIMSSSGSVMCDSCNKVRKLGIYNEQGQHNESAFVDGTVKSGKTAKVLLKKIDKHKDSSAHKTALEILARKEADHITNFAKKAENVFFQQNEEKINVTEKVFRTAYECGRSHLPFAQHPLTHVSWSCNS